MPEHGRRPEPGGWNRLVITVDDLEARVAELKQAGLAFRNEIVTGPGGKPFDTFVVEMNETGQNSYRSVSRWWISPEAKYLIRFDSSDSNNVSSRALVTAITK